MPLFTWVGSTSNDYGTGSNWTGGALPNTVPTATDTILFNGANPCTTGATNRTCAGVSFGTYTGTLTIQSNLTCNGNLTMQSAQNLRTSGTGTFIIGANSTITPNGGDWGSNLQIGNTGTIQVTITSGFSVNGTLTFTGGSNLIGGGGVNISARGNVVASTGCAVTTSSTASSTLIFGGNSTTFAQSWSGSGLIGCNVDIAAPTTAITILSDVNFGVVPTALIQVPTLKYTSAASMTWTGSTLGITGGVFLDLGNTTTNTVILRNYSSGGQPNSTINLVSNLNVGGDLITAPVNNGNHTITRSGSQTIQLQGSLTISNGSNTASLSTDATGAKIVIIGKASSTSVLSCGNYGLGRNYCNINIDIQAGSNAVTLNDASPTTFFNFGNSTNSASKTLKYISGNFTTANRTINFAHATLDLGAQTLGNVQLLAISPNVTLSLVDDVTITGNLFQGLSAGGAGYGETFISPTGTGTATSLIIQGSFQIGNTTNNGTQGTIKLKFTGTGSTPQTLSGTSNCQNDIEFISGVYTIGNFIYGKKSGTTFCTMKYSGGTVNANATLTSWAANYDIGIVQLQNFTTTFNGGQTTTINIKASNIFRINGDFQNNEKLNINVDPLTPFAQMDVYGNITIGGGGSGDRAIFGNISLYMKGNGTITTGSSYLGVNTFFQGGDMTIGTINFNNGKTIEYLTGNLINTNTSLIYVKGNGTIKSNGRTFCDIQIGGSTNFFVNGNLTCRDLSTEAGGVNQTIGGNGFTISLTRNFTMSGNNNLFPFTGNPLSKIIMTGAGTWSGVTTQALGIDLDLNASGNTITVLGTVGITNSKTLKWYAGTTMVTTGSTLQTGACTLDLGNQLWGNLLSGGSVITNLASSANFSSVIFGNGGGASSTLNGLIPSLTLTSRGNFSNLLTSGTLGSGVGGQNVLLSMDGGGTFSSASATTNLNVQLTSGNTTLSNVGVVNWGGNKSFTRTGGVLVGGTSTFVVVGSNTISIPNVGGGSFWNVNMPANQTITLNAQMGILNNLVLSSTAANIITFASSTTFGFDTKNFTHGGGDTTCILNAGSTYNVSGTFQLLGTNDTTRATLRSSSLSSFTGTANGTTLTLAAPESGSAIAPNMAISQASGVAVGTFGTLLPTRPTIVSNISPLSWLITPAVTPSVGAIAMQSGLKAFFNLAPSTGVALVLYAITKDLDSNGGQTIYAFQSYSDAPSNPQANLFRTLNWNTLAPPVAPIGIGFISVT
jgi:fibronectin-binding autotransporter adhesin